MQRLLPPGLLLAALVAAQGSGDVDAGKRVFFDTGDYEYPSCAHCHATVADAEERDKTGHIRPGSPVFNTAHRGAWKNDTKGRFQRAADASNTCVTGFQKRKALPAAQLADLEAYLRSVSPDRDVKPRQLKPKTPLPESLAGGDAEAGQKHVQVYCGGCHGPDEEHLQPELKPGRRPRRKVARKVRGYVERKGKVTFNPKKGQMSFFSAARLPDAHLIDILAYLGRD